MTSPTLLRDIEPINALALRSLLLIDMSAVFWWKWHAAKGQPVDTAFEYTVGKVRQLADGGYDRAVVCCDSGRSFRYDLDPQYKGTRPPRDPIAVAQLRRALEALRDAGLTLWSAQDWEADDVIATGVAWAAALPTPIDVTIAGTDKDLLQLVGPRVRFLSIMSGEVYDAEGVSFKLGGVKPEQVRDYLAMVGDAADNVKGVKGVGHARAARLLAECGSLVGIMAALDEAERKGADGKPLFTPAIRAALTEANATGLDGGRPIDLAVKLVSLRTDVPIDCSALLTAPPSLAIPIEEPSPTAALAEAEPYPEDEAFEPTPPPPTPPPAPPPDVDPHAVIARMAALAKMIDAPQRHPEPIATKGSQPMNAPAVVRSLGGRFSLANVATTRTSGALASIIYGPPGIGKTRFGGSIGDSFFIPVEDGMDGMNPDDSPGYFKDERQRPIVPRSLDELLDMIDGYMAINVAPERGQPRPYRHLVVDSLSAIESLVHVKTCGSEQVAHMEAKDFKKVWHGAEPHWRAIKGKLSAVRAAGVNVWLLAHAQEVTDSVESGDTFKKWDLLMKGSGDVLVHARQQWRMWANNVLFLDWAATVAKQKIGKQTRATYRGRLLHTTETPRYFAKQRSGLPPTLPATWVDLRAALLAAVPATEPKLRASIAGVLEGLVGADRAAIETELATAKGVHALAGLLSRAQGMAAIADQEKEEAARPAAEEAKPAAAPVAEYEHEDPAAAE